MPGSDSVVVGSINNKLGHRTHQQTEGAVAYHRSTKLPWASWSGVDIEFRALAEIAYKYVVKVLVCRSGIIPHDKPAFWPSCILVPG